VLEKKALELMPSATKDTTLSKVVVGLGALSRSSLAHFVSLSSRGGFDAASEIINQLERGLPIKVEDQRPGSQWGKACQ
jgi:hypothetical protein